MKQIRFLILLCILPLFVITCSEDENEKIERDLTQNVFYVGNNEYLLTDGKFAYVGKNDFPYEILIILYNSDINIVDLSNYSGIGDVFSLTINVADTSGFIPQGTYHADYYEDEEWFLEIECLIDYNTATWEAAFGYIMSSGNMLIEKIDTEYEITINGIGGKYSDDGNLLKSGIEMVAHYKGTLPEISSGDN